MKCAECIHQAELIRTGYSEEVNGRAEWRCPVCGREYWLQQDKSLATTKPEPKKVKPIVWNVWRKFTF